MLATIRCKSFVFQFAIQTFSLKIKIYKAIILPVMLYVCGTWSLTLRKERRLRLFENRALKEDIWNLRAT
jgi:hypothetical protein